MSTRSANNKRTTTGEVTGMARRSASSAKPARAAASSVRVVPASSKARRKQVERGEDLSNLSKEERKARKAELRKQDDRIYAASNYLLNQDEEYNRRRKLWWILLVVACALIFGIWIFVYAMAEQGNVVSSSIQIGLIVVAYVVIIGALVYDFVRIRPLRNMYRTQAEGMSQKQLIALLEKEAAEEDHKRAEKEAAKAAKKNKNK